MDTSYTVHWKTVIAIVVVALTASAAGLYWYFSTTDTSVNDFPSCREAGGIIQESFPRRCIYNQQTYVEEVEQETATNVSEQVMLVIEEERKPCREGSTEQCLVANKEVLHTPIEGFDYQEGNRYKLIVNKITSGAASRPFVYELNEVVSITRIFTPEPTLENVEQENTEVTAEEEEEVFEPRVINTKEVAVAPYQVDCGRFDRKPCYLIDGEPFGQDIQGFDYQSGTSYVIEIEVTQNYPVNEQPEDGFLYSYKLLSIIEPQDSTATSTQAESNNATTEQETPDISVSEN